MKYVSAVWVAAASVLEGVPLRWGDGDDFKREKEKVKSHGMRGRPR